MAKLKLKDTINVLTQHGPCAVDLMIGDITKLEQDNAVDFIMVSAFPGDYTPVPGTLIGALQRNLRINVRVLSQNKELDLRKHFSIWMSKPLEEYGNPPFKRLICFERLKHSHPSELVGDIFRGLMPIVNNQDTSIITPLLATGNQRFSLGVMMLALVSSACNWMKVGLPLRRLKIVLYSSDGSLGDDEKDAVAWFASLKNKWGSSPAIFKNVILYDIYMSYNRSDSKIATEIIKELRKESKHVKIFDERQELEANTSWQEKMFNTMNSCKVIVVVLTTAYMESKECLEQFNIGMCCSRVRGYEMLAPLYLQDIPYVPSYIMLVQYIDCRDNSDHPTKSEHNHVVTHACNQIISSLTKPHDHSEDKFKYDVFISYSHKNATEAERLHDVLAKRDDKMKVFFDTKGLETGFSWQKYLYTVLDHCQCVVAFICDDYLKSPVCMEELSIAIARAIHQENFRLVAVCIADITTTPSWMSNLQLIDGRPHTKLDLAAKLSDQICLFLDDEPNNLHRFELHGTDHHKHHHIEKRHKHIHSNFIVENTGLIHTNTKSHTKYDKLHENVDKIDSSKTCDVYFCYSQDDMTFAAILGHMISDRFNDAVMSYGHESPSERLQKIDLAKIIVIFLSKKFVESTQLMDVLHHVVFRSRKEENKLTYIVQSTTIPDQPTFLHILHCDVNFHDHFWTKFNAKTVLELTKFMVTGTLQGSYSCKMTHVLSLQKAAHDICELLNRNGSGDTQVQDSSSQGVFINALDTDHTENTTVISMDQLLHSIDEPAEIKQGEVKKFHPGKHDNVYIALNDYDPKHTSPNDEANAELELKFHKGDRILVHGDIDEDGFFTGELENGRRGLVPSKFVDKATGHTHESGDTAHGEDSREETKTPDRASVKSVKTCVIL